MVSFTEKTTTDQRNMLILAGFVHVTGLKSTFLSNGSESVIGDNLRHDEVGKYDYNNGVMVIVTVGGEIWIRLGGGEWPISVGQMKELCPRGRGVFVPCSNGELIAFRDIMHRHTDPNWDPHYGS